MARPSKATYTDEQKAHAYVVYETNGGNMKRTARDTNVPESTLRRWRDDWAGDGGPPDTSLIVAEVTEIVADMERVRNKALLELERKLPDATPSALVAAIGMLQDKVQIAKGLATSRTETVVALPSAEDIAKTLGAVLQGALSMAQERAGDIIDAEFIEQAPSGELNP